jgi:hypothetical protein
MAAFFNATIFIILQHSFVQHSFCVCCVLHFIMLHVIVCWFGYLVVCLCGFSS